MAEFIVQAFEIIDVNHDDGHAGVKSPSALDLFRNTQLKKSAVEDSRQTIEICQLFDPFHIMSVLDGCGTNIGDRFQRLRVAGLEGARFGAVQKQHT